MIKPFPSDRIGRESMKKRMAETCMWRNVNGRYVPGCVTDFSSYAYATTVCIHCGKRVEIKKNV